MEQGAAAVMEDQLLTVLTNEYFNTHVCSLALSLQRAQKNKTPKAVSTLSSQNFASTIVLPQTELGPLKEMADSRAGVRKMHGDPGTS